MPDPDSHGIAAAFLAVAEYNALLSFDIRPVAAALLIFLGSALSAMFALAAFAGKMKMWSLWPKRAAAQIHTTFASIKSGLFDVKPGV